ncbi:MAG: APC family permease [Acidobacteria bacterium]|nr:APC family permease [Acidobacteriota bacterium]
MSDPQSLGGGLRRELGLLDVVLFNIAAILGLRWLSTAAASGPSSLVVWALAFLFFFVPQGLTVIELSSRYPQEGGIYRWTQRAFGGFHGFVAGWCYWTSNLIYFPSLLIFAAGSAAFVGGESTIWLGDNPWFVGCFSLAALWIALGLNLVGLKIGKWLQNVGAIGNWVPGLILVVLGLWVFLRFGSAVPVERADLVPVFNRGTASFWAMLCFAFAGLELAPLMAGEIRSPKRTLPRAVLISGGMITFVYVLGTLSLLVALPPSEVNIISGVVQALESIGARLGLTGLSNVVGLLIAVAALGGVGAWFTGAARIPYVAGIDRYLPAAMGRIHPRWGTPHVSLLVQGVLSSLFLIWSMARTSGVEEAYQVLITATLLIYFIPFLYMFAALPVLRRKDPVSPGGGAILIPGGKVAAWVVPALGLITTLTAMGFSLFPSQVVEEELDFLVTAVGGCVLFVGSGALLYWVRRPR